jgi:hypothetical protein
VVVALLAVIGAAVAHILRTPPGFSPAPDEDRSGGRGPASLRPPDNAPVIGVSAGGRHRAYLVSALLRPETHVYNDLLGDDAVTVTFCDVDQCVRVFRVPGRGRPLDVDQGGPDASRPGKMLLRVGPARYWQDTGERLEGGDDRFPYAEATFVRTTWKEWRDAHPDTDVFVGPLASAPRDPVVKYALPPTADAPPEAKSNR